ncbi:MAG TPA: tetratricopeptide repeat protein, partial [Polyangiaceae bacterium]|nr:tetratricopeptide repeat protein [Polyangiaceae bacterium]
MFKVECPGCKAPYQVDERRIPQSGLKMRCPKCGSSFKVESPSEAQRPAPPPVLGAVLGVTSDSLVPPPEPAAAPKGASALKATMLGVAPAAPQAPRPAAPPAPPRPKASSHADEDLPSPVDRNAADLPSPAVRKGPPPAPPRGKPPAPPAPAPSKKVESEPPLEVEDFTSEPPDLPATAAKAPPRPAHADLPAKAAPRAEPFAPRASATAQTRPAFEKPQLPQAAAPGATSDLPNLAGTSNKARAGFGEELDLPSLSGSGPSGGGAPKGAAPARPTQRSFGDIELDLPDAALRGRRSQPELDLDLPDVSKQAPRASTRSSAPEFDLPSLQHGFDLPSPADNLPALGELPSISNAGLPAVSQGALPALGQGTLPSLSQGGLPSVSSIPPAIGMPAGTPHEARPDPISLPPLELDGPPQPSPRRSFGELDLEGLGPSPARTPSGARPAMSSRPDDSLEADPFGEADLPPPRSLSGASAQSAPRAAARFSSGPPAALGAGPAGSAQSPVIRQAGGGTAYGEVNLGEGISDEVALDGASAPRAAMSSEQDMEFGDVPQEPSAPTAAATAPVSSGAAVARPSGPVSRRAADAAAKPAGRKRAFRSLALLGVLVVGGAALAFVPDVGPFGAYFIIDQVKAGQYAELVATTATQTRKALAKDTAPDAKAAAQHIEEVRAASPRVRSLRTFAAYVAVERELRFGADAELHARAKVLLDEFEGREGLPYLTLARAGRAASEGQFDRARQLLGTAPNDVDALFLRGEIELRARNAAEALATWQKLDAQSPSARTKFGVARAAFTSGDRKLTEQAAKAALAENPAHVGAKILLARLAADSAREAEAIQLLEQVTKAPESASSEERVMSNTTLGDIHLGRSRITRAEAAYTEALKIDPKAARALLGIGEALFRAGRYSEAQARFEAAAQADPSDVAAKVGVAKSKLMLERVDEATSMLKSLRNSDPKSLLIGYWYARALEAVGNRDEAEKVYTQGIAKTSTDPMLVDTYIALAMLQNQQGRAEVARKTLAQAREKLPSSSAIYKALGEVAISQARYA